MAELNVAAVGNSDAAAPAQQVAYIATARTRGGRTLHDVIEIRGREAEPPFRYDREANMASTAIVPPSRNSILPPAIVEDPSTSEARQARLEEEKRLERARANNRAPQSRERLPVAEPEDNRAPSPQVAPDQTPEQQRIQEEIQNQVRSREERRPPPETAPPPADEAVPDEVEAAVPEQARLRPADLLVVLPRPQRSAEAAPEPEAEDRRPPAEEPDQPIAKPIAEREVSSAVDIVISDGRTWNSQKAQSATG